MRKKDDSRMTTAQKIYKFDYKNRVLERLVLKPSQLVFVDRPPVAVKTSNFKTIGSPTQKRLMSAADGL